MSALQPAPPFLAITNGYSTQMATNLEVTYIYGAFRMAGTGLMVTRLRQVIDRQAGTIRTVPKAVVYGEVMARESHKYDVAMSFSGAQRAYVRRVVRECEALGLHVFYDENDTVQLWGQNLIPQLRKVYGGVASRYVIPFLSRDYLAGSYPMDELYTAISASVERGDGYILPVMMDDVNMPPELLNPAVLYLRGDDYTPERLAEVLAEKVGLARQRHQEPRDVGSIVESALQVRMPRIPPNSFDREDALDGALDRVAGLFDEHSRKLEDYGYTCRVRRSDSAVRVRVQERGNPVCELKLAWGDDPWGDKLTVAFAWPRIQSTGVNGWVSAEWDGDRQQPVLRYEDMTASLAPKRLDTAEALFGELWEKVVSFIEHRGR